VSQLTPPADDRTVIGRVRAAIVRVATRIGLQPTIVNALGYVIASVATGFVSFLTVPLLTRTLGIVEYGRWSLIEPILLITTQCALVGINYGIIKAFALDHRPAAPVFMVLVIAGMPAALLVCTAAALFLGRLAIAFGDRIWFVVWAYLEATFALAQSALRGADQPRAYGTATVLKGLVLLGALFLAERAGWTSVTHAESVIRVSALSAAAGVVVALLALSHLATARTSPPPRGGLYADAVRYGAPILASGLLVQASSFFDRYLLAGVMDSSAVGSLVVHAKVASIANPIVTAPLALWWPTVRFNHLNDADGGDAFFGATAVMVLQIYLVVAGTLWFAAPMLVSWFAAGISFQPAVVAGYLIAMVCSGMSNPLNIGLLQQGRTHLNIYGVFGGAGLQLVLNVILVPRYGAAGAAGAAAAGALASMLVLTALSQRVHPVRFPFARLAGLVLLYSAVGAGVSVAVPAAMWPARYIVFLGLASLSTILLRAFTPRIRLR
jgi:O-antigen/teichoic acid export membrane protein